MTSAYTDLDSAPAVADVYPPQQDSYLLIQAMRAAGVVPGARVADLCTGSGVVAIAAAMAGAESVVAFDICPKAVQHTRSGARAAGVAVEVHRGSWARAAEFGPFDVVVANPPYVPRRADGDFPGDSPGEDVDVIPGSAGPARAWDAGTDGRLILDPLCAAAPLLLAPGGSMFVVHSECADIERTVGAFRALGMTVDVVAEQLIPFGPVMTARAPWLRSVGLLGQGDAFERIGVVHAQTS